MMNRAIYAIINANKQNKKLRYNYYKKRHISFASYMPPNNNSGKNNPGDPNDGSSYIVVSIFASFIYWKIYLYYF